MADTERLDRLEERTEINPKTDRREHDVVYVNQATLRKMICQALRLPTICYGVVLVGVLLLGQVLDQKRDEQLSDLRADLATQQSEAKATAQRVDTISATSEQDAAKVAGELKELNSRVSYVKDSIDDFRNTTDKIDGRLTELSERMDRAAAEVNREAEARRDLIRSMDAFGQRLQRQ